MKQILFFLIIAFLSIGCKAQTIYPLEGPYGNSSDSKPWYIKDLNNTRNAFVGACQSNVGSIELTIYLYKLDGVANGLGGPEGKQFQDGIMGYYIYKENGIEILNSRDNLLNPLVPNNQSYGPIFGYTFDGVEMTDMRFVDYGIEIPNQNGAKKRGNCNIIITNPGENTLQATFELFNQPHIIGEYNYGFSIPTQLTLTKVTDTPPPLD